MRSPYFLYIINRRKYQTAPLKKIPKKQITQAVREFKIYYFQRTDCGGRGNPAPTLTVSAHRAFGTIQGLFIFVKVGARSPRPHLVVEFSDSLNLPDPGIFSFSFYKFRLAPFFSGTDVGAPCSHQTKGRTSAPFPKRPISRAKPFSGDYFGDFFRLL
jgi:hypothetical protein